MRKLKISLTTKIFIGLIAGIVLGYLNPEWGKAVRPLSLLFLNLIKNAVEAVGDSGLLKVTSRVLADYSMTQKGERPSRMVAVDISDDGPGIKKAHLEQLFTPFFTTKTGGTGLGLAICQKIVSEHRGMIKVDSEPARGTTFTVMLPLIQ